MEKLKAKGVRAFAIANDQGDTKAAKPMIDGVITQFGKLDILVNNAAVVAKGQQVVGRKVIMSHFAQSNSEPLISTVMPASVKVVGT